MVDMVKSLGIAVSTLVKRLGILQSTIVSALDLDIPAGGTTSFHETAGSAGVQSREKDIALTNMDETGFYCRADVVSVGMRVNTINDLITVFNNIGNPAAWVALENATITDLDSTHDDEVIVDLQMEVSGGSTMIEFANAGTEICHVELTILDTIIDNQAGSRSFPGTDVYTDRLVYEFVFDFAANTFTLTIGGQAVFSGVAFSNNTNDIDTIRVVRWTNQDTYVRDIKVGSGII